jgi:hypothetical protein
MWSSSSGSMQLVILSEHANMDQSVSCATLWAFAPWDFIFEPRKESPKLIGPPYYLARARSRTRTSRNGYWCDLDIISAICTFHITNVCYW